MEPSERVGPEARSRGARVVAAVEATLRAIQVVTKVVALATGLVFGAAVFLGVFYRYVLGSPFPYAVELPRVLFPWFIMSGAILAAARDEHLRLEVLTGRLPRAARTALLAVTSLLVIFSLWVLADVATTMLPRVHQQTTPLLGWRASYGFASVPVGLGGIAVAVALRLVVALLQGPPPADTPPPTVG